MNKLHQSRYTNKLQHDLLTVIHLLLPGNYPPDGSLDFTSETTSWHTETVDILEGQYIQTLRIMCIYIYIHTQSFYIPSYHGNNGNTKITIQTFPSRGSQGR